MADDRLLIDGRVVPLAFKRNARAKRYILRVVPSGDVRVTVPRYGTLKEAHAFVERHLDWLRAQIVKHEGRSAAKSWQHGSEFLFRGERLSLNVADGLAYFELKKERIEFSLNERSVKVSLISALRRAACKELPDRAWELAIEHGFHFNKVSVRNQKMRWGSCSCSKTISLNWRLIQCPAFVRDYVILHELSHLVHMDHSVKFWNKVGRVCPDYEEAERWLKANAGLLESLR